MAATVIIHLYQSRMILLFESPAKEFAVNESKGD